MGLYKKIDNDCHKASDLENTFINFLCLRRTTYFEPFSSNFIFIILFTSHCYWRHNIFHYKMSELNWELWGNTISQIMFHLNLHKAHWIAYKRERKGAKLQKNVERWKQICTVDMSDCSMAWHLLEKHKMPLSFLSKFTL